MAASAAFAGAASAANLPNDFQQTVAFSGLDQPTAVRFAPDGRVFVAEKSGLIKAFNGLGDPAPDVVADLRTNVMDNWDRGMLGLAVHPSFPTAPYIYVFYTYDALPGGVAPYYNDVCPNQQSQGCPMTGRLSRLQVGQNNQMVGGEQVLIANQWCTQYPSHESGDLRFGPEGALYLTAGEGASFNFIDHGQVGNPCGDPMGSSSTGRDDEGGAFRSQDLLTPGDPTSYDGALLRLDVDTLPVRAWPTNPLVGVGPPDDDPVIAFGLRNPFRFAIRPGSGEVWVGDVAQHTWEEINVVADPDDAIVENFGWPCYEGGNGVLSLQVGYAASNFDLCNALYEQTIPTALRAPFFGYRQAGQIVSGENCTADTSSVSGIAFYQGGDYPAQYQNAAFFQDASKRCIWVMFPDASGNPDPANVTTFLTQPSGRPVDLQIGPGGDLFYAGLDSGNILRIEHFPLAEPPIAVLQAAPTSGPTPLAVSFDASASYDNDPGSVLAYSWDLDGDGAFDDAPAGDPRFAQFTYDAGGLVPAAVRVTDETGLSSVATAGISADNSPPTATIVTPTEGFSWRVGDLILFSGTGSDPEDGTLGAGSLSWQTLIHHCATPQICHTHPYDAFDGVEAGQLVAPDHEYPAWLELQLTVRDSSTGWLDPAWTRRRKLAFQNAGEPAAVVDFPVLVTLDASRIDYELTQDSGADLRFVDPDGTILPHEIEEWNENGKSYVWVRVPRIDGASDSDFVWLYYGNPAASDAQQPEGVWDAAFAGVWHLRGDLLDSTANQHDASNNGSSPALGNSGPARHFDGNDWLDAGNAASLALTGQLTVEAWIQIDDPGQTNSPSIVSKKPGWNSNQGYQMEYKPDVNKATIIGSGSNTGVATGVNLDTSWHYLATTIDGASAAIYVDGVNRTVDGSTTPLASGSQALHIGRRSGGGNYFRGAIDEVRLSSLRRSQTWIATQHRSMSDALLGYGASDAGNSLSTTVSRFLYPQTLTLSFHTVPSGLDVTVASKQNPAPFSDEFIVNSLTTISAPTPQEQGGIQQLFSSWSDGGAQSHDVTVLPGQLSYTASFTPAPGCGDGDLDEGEECDDGNAVEGDCCSSSCALDTAGSACTDDGNSCTTDVCDALGACIHAGRPDDSPCDDGNACTQNDTCQAGSCSGGSPLICLALDACHLEGVCDPATGVCSNPLRPDGAACDDGNACTQTDRCQSGTCAGSDPITCVAPDACQSATCDPGTGTCSNAPKPDGASCSDGDLCTQGETCQAGVCGGANPVVCTPLDSCHLAGSCDPGSGVCSNPPMPDGSACSDGNACTQTDACQAGICTGIDPVACGPLDQCHEAGTCDPITGACSNPAKPDGSACSDGDLCTQTDTCQAGGCSGLNPVICGALDSCHAIGTCDPATGICANPTQPDGTSCDDGNLCTLSDACQMGVCTGDPIATCNSWARRRKLGFDNSGQAETLVGFPVLVALDASRIDYGLTQDTGQDLRFVDVDGALIPHEIEQWNEGGTSYIWVRVPAIDASSTSDFIWMYYGNPSAADAQSPAAVWDATYAGVWHLRQDLLDSTASSNDGTNNGSVDAAGKLGSGRAFDGNDWIAVPSSASLSITGQLTVEAWIKINDSAQAGSPSLVSKKPLWSSAEGYQMEYKPGTNRSTLIGSGSNYASATGVDLDTSWHYLAGTQSGASAALYVDGVNRTVDASSTPLAAGAQALAIGRRSGGGDYFQGALDEVRLSNVARSGAWVRAQNLSMTDAFTSFGPVESDPPPPGP